MHTQTHMDEVCAHTQTHMERMGAHTQTHMERMGAHTQTHMERMGAHTDTHGEGGCTHNPRKRRRRRRKTRRLRHGACCASRLSSTHRVNPPRSTCCRIRAKFRHISRASSSCGPQQGAFQLWSSLNRKQHVSNMNERGGFARGPGRGRLAPPPPPPADPLLVRLPRPLVGDWT